jgi:tetratricopeptide (TPR) repeat protein
MKKVSIVITIIAIIASFIGGFLVANSLNRSELNDLRSKVVTLQKNQKDDSDKTLTKDEIQARIAEADKNPENIDFQKNLAFALYAYANSKQDASLLPDILRILRRVYAKDDKNVDVVRTLGNLLFDIGQSKNDNANLIESREFYQKVLILKPNDVEIQTDLATTYLLETPPNAEKAMVELQKSLLINAKDEKTLQAVIQVNLMQNKLKEAEDSLKKLKEVNPNNKSINDLETQMSQLKNR